MHTLDTLTVNGAIRAEVTSSYTLTTNPDKCMFKAVINVLINQ